MKVLYLSSLCSVKEYERMFKKYGSTSSHAAQKFNRLLVKGLLENGCNVDALTQRIIVAKDTKDDYICLPEKEDGVYYKYLPRVRNKTLNRIKTIMRAFKEIKRWSKINPDGAIICDIILGELSLALWCAKHVGVKNKMTAIVTDVPSIRAGDNRKGLRAVPMHIKNKMIQFFDSYIFLTEQMNTKLNQNQKPYVVIEGIVDSSVVEEANVLEKKSCEKVCMMAGLLEEIYGVQMLIEAFTEIEDPNARLVFYGKGSSVEQIEKISQKDKRIQYKGELTNAEIVKEEKKATFLLNPRPPIGAWTAYSFPSKNMEYMASGTPLIAYDLPCIPKEYNDYFFPIREVSKEGIKEILQVLLKKDREEIHAFGLNAQKWIVQHKCASRQAKKIVDMLNDEMIR